MYYNLWSPGNKLYDKFNTVLEIEIFLETWETTIFQVVFLTYSWRGDTPRNAQVKSSKVALVFLHILPLDTNENKVEDLLVFLKF